MVFLVDQYLLSVYGIFMAQCQLKAIINQEASYRETGDIIKEIFAIWR